ncbi:MAG: hypothetical protein JRJ38_16920 [Deltaproteobacteria bacterium]|nr:hypothetical protein [Deltaproteobacteria bacterium]
MRQTMIRLTVLVAAAALVTVLPGSASAAVQGICSNCHTMHYSQGGTSMHTGWGTGGPYTTLLLNDCLGCHTTTGSDPLVGAYPYVKLGSGATNDNCLAGGFFRTAGPQTGDNNSNENHDIGATAAPAGFDGAETTWYTGTTNGLGCAGTNGCHGNQSDLDDMAAISGGHHSPSAYRMLYVGSAGVTGSGVGTNDYEEALISSPSTTAYYNVYSADVSGDTTISELCAKCHGDFHNESGSTTDCGTAGAWIRHPTDNLIPTSWAISSNVGPDDLKWNPPGYAGATVTAGAERVTCISCHRAHGTAENDLLRFNYGTQLAGQTSSTVGCLGCHDRQR